MLELDKTQKIIFDALHDGVLIINNQDIVQYVNKAYSRITGVAFETIVGQPLNTIRPGSRLGGVMRSGKPLLGVKRTFGDIEYMTDMHPIFIEDKCVGGISIVRDVAEIQELQLKLGKYRIRYNNLLRKFNKNHMAIYTFKDIIGAAPALKQAKELAAKLAISDMPILIRGESGTGKELFAHAIHMASQRVKQSFVVVNCAAIPGPLLESELFGYAEGAFSGAKHGGKQGLIALAHNGTLFLDEIGDMPLDLQAKILRVMQSGEIQPVGNESPLKVNIRVLAATNVDLEKKILAEKFRMDLFYRLNAAQIIVPPLRKRREDILPTAEYFLQKHFIEHPLAPLQLSADTKQALHDFHWPGNVRELENTIQFIGNLTESRIISSKYLPGIFHSPEPIVESSPTNNLSLDSIELKKKRLDIEIKLIRSELAKCGSSVEAKKLVAKKLGISLSTLYQRLALIR